MKNPLTFLFRSRDKPSDAVSSAMTFFFGGSNAGKLVTPRNAIQVSTVYACVRVIGILPSIINGGEPPPVGGPGPLDQPEHYQNHESGNPE